MTPDGGYGGLAKRGFSQVLTRAIADISEHGFGDVDRIQDWLFQLRVAAERELGQPERVDAEMRRALEAIYGRLIDKGGVARHVPGIPRYGIAMVRPQARAELDRRIFAATDLIKLRRGEAVDKTLRQVSGWMSSIPPGGVSDESRREVKARVGASLKQYRYEQRRVAIDQGHKLIANVADIVAMDNGAIAGEWIDRGAIDKSYDARKDHLERSGKIYLVRDSWAAKEGLLRAVNGYMDEITRPAQEPACSCRYRYIVSPRRLPDEFLTERGRQWIARGQGKAA